MRIDRERDSERVFSTLKTTGFLRLSDPMLPSVCSLITGEPLRIVPLVLAFLCCCCSVAAQTQQPISSTQNFKTQQTSYVFISPNTRENLNFTDALENLNSQEEISLIRKAREIGCAVGINSRIVKALGSWSDGIEHSTIIKASTNEATLRYLASRLGKHARQKAVLYFRRNSSGTGRMYILFIPRFKNGETGIIKALDRGGVAYRTLVPGKKRILVYIVDLKNELGHRIAAVSGRLRAHLLLLRGEQCQTGNMV